MRTLSIVCLSALLALPVVAKETKTFEITPFAGYRFGGDFDYGDEDSTTRLKLEETTSFGLLTAWRFDTNRQGEVLISHYSTNFSQHSDFIPTDDELAITYAHVGGNVTVSKSSFATWHVAGGLGFTHMSPQDNQLDNETRFSMNLGLIGKIPVSENVSLHLSGRVYGTFFNSDSSIFCNEDNCLISISSDLWVQQELAAGISVAF